ncbi:MAG TPA: SCO family protein [Candidatus Angelobacter sp.]|jgi:cytochrome oxidase Cu insertion factor (SCO1/SenC/PrrC family)|nr:SCO family protein [Candidatus Angelobacter sp.]
MRGTSFRTIRAGATVFSFLVFAIAVTSQSSKGILAQQVQDSNDQQSSTVHIAIPDVVLTDQDGHALHFNTLVQDKVAVINTVFTSCTTICPIMGANFTRLEKLLGPRVGPEVLLISISVDPVNDTPARLRAWKDKFHAGPGWTLLTGPKTDVDSLLKTLQLFAADKQEHSPLTLIGSGKTGQWRRVSGLTTPAQLVDIVGSTPVSAAQKYFTDTLLMDQDGKQLRFYSDLLKGKVVVINSFFTTCKDSCPIMAATLARIQEKIGDRLGKSVYLISITVDPEVDTPAKLKEFAEHIKAKPGWEFVTGSKENLDLVLRKIGQYAENRDSHTSLFIIGNEPTGLWKKSLGTAKSDDIISIVESVMNDPG